MDAHIAEYRVQQAWQLSRDGRIAAQIWSRGISCSMDHVHHVYWRLDFDVNDSEHNKLWVQDSASGAIYTREKGAQKKPGRYWLIHNSQTGQAVWLIPGSNDGTADAHAPKDLFVRRYH